MKAVSVLEPFSDHGSIHQKTKKNTTSVRSYPNSAGDAVSTFHDPGFFRHPLSSLPFRPFSPVVARSFSLYRLSFDQLPGAGSGSLQPELANLVMVNSSEGIDSEILYSVMLFMDFGFQDTGTIVLRQKDINLVTGKPFRIKICCSSQMLINSLREDTEYLLDLGVNGMGQSNRTLPVVWLGRVNRYPYPRIKCIKYRNLNQVTRAEIYLLLKRESMVEKINAATCVTVLDLWKWYFRRSLMINYPKHTTCVMPVGMYIIKKSRFKFLCAYYGCNLTTLILRLLEQIDVSRMVDIDILMEIWKNRVKKIDFVLKWLSRVGSEVDPIKDKLETWASLFRVHNVDIVK
ncbi:uncharacterized protein TNCV_1852761 [Trichonephila clavipes]|nr:uncharacterized protein TNCV_1852761 [Trichonephila clavipes]